MRTNYNKIRDDAGKKPEESNETEIPKETNETEIQKEPIYAVVTNCARLNVRESGSKDFKILCIIREGDKVSILTKGTFWTHIQLDNGTQGYVMTDFIKEV